MNPDEIKAKAATLAELYTAKANGKVLQWYHLDHGWQDQGDHYGPAIQSDLSRWRVKPEPRRMWTREDGEDTHCEERAAEWKRRGIAITEWQEVLP